MAQLQWYPGHMAKAQREIEGRMKLVDMVIELVDARAPFSSRNHTFDRLLKNKPRLVIMTKKDLADPACTQTWIQKFEERGYKAIAVDLKHFKDTNKIIQYCLEILKDKRENEARKGLKPRAIRAMIVGVPNVGKSTLINALAKRKATVTGNKPGVTKAQQIIRVNKDFELFDTPGVLPPKYDDLEIARNVALIGSIKRDILPLDELFIYALSYLNKNYPDALKNRYQLTFDENDDWVLDAYEQIAKVRHLPLLKGEIDYERVQDLFFKDLSDGVFGGITWEKANV